MRKKLLCVWMVGIISAFLCSGCGSTDTQPTEQLEIVESTEQPSDEQPSDEQSPSETAESTEQSAVEPEEAEEPIEEPAETLTEIPEVVDEPQAQYTYNDFSATMYAQQSVNVRDLPSTDGNRLGGLSTNQEVAVIGQCNETGWYRFEYNGSVAYVSNKYLGDSKVEVAQAGNGGGNSSLESFPYPMYQLLGDKDNGYCIYFVTHSSKENDDLVGDLTIQALNEIIYAEFEKNTGLTGINMYSVAGYYAEGKVEKVDIYAGTWPTR